MHGTLCHDNDGWPMKNEILICNHCGINVHGAVASGEKCEACKRGVLMNSHQESTIDTGDSVFYDFSTKTTKNTHLQIRLTMRDKKSIQNEAKRKGMTITDYLIGLHRAAIAEET